MKDYSNEEIERNSYILSYKVNSLDKTIICKLANGKEHTLPYSKETEKQILSIMEMQIENAELESFPMFCPFFTGFFSMSTLVNLQMYMYGHVSGDLLKYNAGFIGTILGLVAFNIGALQMVDRKEMEIDYKKLKYYRENKDAINEAIKAGMNYNGVSHKTFIKICVDESIGLSPLNANGLDTYKLKDLKKLREKYDMFTKLDQTSGAKGRQYTYSQK